MNKSELARQIVKKYPNVSKKELGKRLKKNYPQVFKDDEDGRKKVREVTDADGKQNHHIQATNYHKEKNAERTGKITSDKKVGKFDWREAVPLLKGLQEIVKKGKSSQDVASWKIDADEIVVAFIGDLLAPIFCR